MGHATGELFLENLAKALNDNGPELGTVEMLGSDGPNVNKTVWNKLNQNIQELDKPGLVDIGFYNLHVAYNGFHKHMESYGLALSEFIIDIYYFFVQSAARWEDYQLVQEKLGLPKYKFVKHLDV